MRAKLYELDVDDKVIGTESAGLLPTAEALMNLKKIRSHFAWTPDHNESELVQLMAGAGYFTVTDTYFVATDKSLPSSSSELLDELFQSLYVTMVPPKLMAEVMMELNIEPHHALFGLLLKRAVQDGRLTEAEVLDMASGAEMLAAAKLTSDFLKMAVRHSSLEDRRDAYYEFEQEVKSTNLLNPSVCRSNPNVRAAFDEVYSFIQKVLT